MQKQYRPESRTLLLSHSENQRNGGDEYIVVFSGDTKYSDVDNVLQKIRYETKQNTELSQNLFLSASVSAYQKSQKKSLYLRR